MKLKQVKKNSNFPINVSVSLKPTILLISQLILLSHDLVGFFWSKSKVRPVYIFGIQDVTKNLQIRKVLLWSFESHFKINIYQGLMETDAFIRKLGKVFNEKLGVVETHEKLTFSLGLSMNFDPWAPQALHCRIAKLSNEASGMLETHKEHSFVQGSLIFLSPKVD